MAPPTRPVYDEDPDALYRGMPPPVPKIRPISATDRLLRPTKASLAASRKKALTGKDKEVAQAHEVARKRRRLARVAKESGRLTIPQSPKLSKMRKNRSRSRADMLTRTSRELLEIAAIRKRVQAQKRKTRKYHDATSGALSSSSQFSRSLTASGSVGVPAVRRPKLTTPVGFQFEIDKRAAGAETRRRLKRKSVAVKTKETEEAENEPLRKQRRQSAAA
ncbi:Phosphatidylinositol kinase [Phytophthora megakarya]|uniref:Phosphatidylinositol kinase n=1 Tax=Phytophthora megakarya TaxID=4795 RepID=A0A225X078_9STRA|nr:Phosphatidylinositol kinase [Phytophthora megakarya]